MLNGTVAKVRRVVDETRDQPRAGDSINLRALAGDSSHEAVPLGCKGLPAAFQASIPPTR